jgi:hypothetical protein
VTAREASYPTRRGPARSSSKLRQDRASPGIRARERQPGDPHVSRERPTWNSYRGRGRHKGGKGSNGGLPDTWVDGHAASYVRKYVRCGKPRCARLHGPYKYLTWRDDNGRVRTKYAGRA